MESPIFSSRDTVRLGTEGSSLDRLVQSGVLLR
jgi:hypothetical protein